MNLIQNSQLIESYFGYWPTFHDDYIDSCVYKSEDRSCTIIVRSETNKDKKCTINFKFKGIKRIEIGNPLDTPAHSNIIFEMKFNKTEDTNLIKVDITSSMGMCCMMECEEVEVVNLEPIS